MDQINNVKGEKSGKKSTEYMNELIKISRKYN